MNLQEQKELTLANLKKVYKELPELAKKMPSIISDFDMNEFGVLHALTKDEITHNYCLTNGCLLGNIARLFELDDRYFLARCPEPLYNYDLFGAIQFPFLYNKEEKGCCGNHIWRFLFDGRWTVHQPTFEQAMKRVKYAIDYNLDIPVWRFREEDFIFTK